MSKQTETESLGIGSNALSATQAFGSFMDGQEQTDVNIAKDQTKHQTSGDGTNQIATENIMSYIFNLRPTCRNWKN